MCSTPVQRIAEIRQAIDEVAAQAAAAEARNARASKVLRAGEGAAGHGRASEARANDSDQVVIRLAELWARLAELDPEVARRLPIYEA